MNELVPEEAEAIPAEEEVEEYQPLVRPISEGDFDQMLVDTDGLILVDFWADWCAPCKMIAPIVQELAEEYSDRIKVGKLDVDSNPKTASQFGIRGIPTLLIFIGGKPVDQIVGAVNKTVLKKRIDEALST